ncbi:MAG TPA: S49 family peptidase [Isosphaeraceae bacterium]|jgi:protease-4|nr:S49 family peptidase [Isosphaeraceae bacterium]
MQPSISHRCWLALAASLLVGSGCHAIPIHGTIHTDANANVQGAFQAKVDVHMPTTTDPGPMVPSVVRHGASGPGCPRVALIDVDGLLLNQNLTGLYSAGENPVAAFREKLEAAASDLSVRAIVVRINSPGGGVTATDILSEELRRFRGQTGKPAVACLMDLATGGAYYLAIGCDRVVAHPTTVTGGVGAMVNHFNLQDAASQLNVSADPVKAGDLVDMGSVMGPLKGEPRELLQAMINTFRDRFLARVTARRPAMTAQDRKAIADGRVITGPQAHALHMVDRVGYADDAIAEAEHLASVSGAEVILFQHAGNPAHSIYAITPNVPIQNDLIPFSYPGLDRSKLPTFLYLWQPDPTLIRQSGR